MSDPLIFIAQPGQSQTIQPLGDHPRLYYRSLLRSAHQLAATLFQEYEPDGLNFFCITLTDAAYEQHRVNRALEHPDEPLLPMVREAYPVSPPYLANSTTAALNMQKYHRARAAAFHIELAKFTAALEVAIGPVNLANVRQTCVSLKCTPSVKQIFAFLEREYSILTTEDVVALSVFLNNYVLEDPRQLYGYRIALSQWFDDLALYAPRHAYLEISKVQVFLRGLRQFPIVDEFYTLYRRTVVEETYASLATFVHASPDFRRMASAFGTPFQGQPHNTATHPSAAHSFPFVAATTAIVHTAASFAPATLATTGRGGAGRHRRGGGGAGRGGRGRRSGSGRGGQGSSSGSSDCPVLYCFAHGYGGHPGSACTKMATDSSYTPAMQQATAPCTLDGWSGSSKRKRMSGE